MKFIETLKKAAEDRREVLMREFRARIRSIHKSVFKRKPTQTPKLSAAYWSSGIENVPFEDPEFPIQWL